MMQRSKNLSRMRLNMFVLTSYTRVLFYGRRCRAQITNRTYPLPLTLCFSRSICSDGKVNKKPNQTIGLYKYTRNAHVR
jgi:hypothetical protein